jgi:Na+-translocating ferredoxin:NAD+ oxidoreductase RnfE subunit
MCFFPWLQAYFKLAEMQSSGQQVPLAAVNCVILGCANVWDADRAYQTFDAIGSTFGLTPDVHSINALLDAFGKNRKVGTFAFSGTSALLWISIVSNVMFAGLIEVNNVLTSNLWRFYGALGIRVTTCVL